MACPRFFLFALIRLCLLSVHLIGGIEIPKDATLIVTQQNTSSLHVDISIQIAPQMISKIDATKQTMFHNWANLRIFRGEHYGFQSSLNVYGLPIVENGQTSAMTIGLINRSKRTHKIFNLILAGWRVDPDRYGDHDTHFFIYWTVDENYETGCIDLDCKGFVLHSTSQLVPGYRLQPLSEYNGEQRFITLKISKDRTNGDWWLHYGSNGTKPVGYWPQSLFTSLANSASNIHIGGKVTFLKGKISPPMGSGHDVIEGEGKAASIKYPRLVDENGNLHIPRMHGYDYYFDGCYKITGNVASTLYVGGPGGCKD